MNCVHFLFQRNCNLSSKSHFFNKTMFLNLLRKYSLSATFQEFVAYLLDLKNGDVTKDVIDHGSAVLKSTSVRHWQTYYRLTYPCYINYDVIAHMETIDEDARFVIIKQ